jgi:hypothetical protein
MRASQEAWDEYRRVQHEKLTIKDPSQIAVMTGVSLNTPFKDIDAMMESPLAPSTGSSATA